MWMDIFLVLLSVLLTAVIAIPTTLYLERKKNEEKPKLWLESTNPVSLQWGWSRRDSCFSCFTYINIWYQNRSNLGKTIRRVKLKSLSQYVQDVTFSISLTNGMPAIEPNSAPHQVAILIDCKSVVKRREQLPSNCGSMNIDFIGADGLIDEVKLSYQFLVPDNIPDTI